jgi:hypothetical protein
MPRTARELATLAVWATKTALVFDAANPLCDHLFKPSVAEVFYSTRKPPVEAEIRLTACVGDRPHFLDASGLGLDDGFDPSRGWRQAVAIAWTIGPFAFLYCPCTVPGVLHAVGLPGGPNVTRLWPMVQSAGAGVQNRLSRRMTPS